MADARVQVVINAVDNASKQLRTLSGRMNDLARTAGQAGRSMLALGAPVVAAATGAVKLFSDFESSMSRIVGLVGISTEQVDEWKDVLLEMAPAVGKGPKELADALFFITSAGLRGEEAIEALNAAAKASTAGLGETKIVADALTSAMNAYAKSGLSAEQSTSILVATVREGKAEADSIAQSLGRVIPIAAEMGISFDQVGAAIAAMTRLGLDADESSTALRQVMATLLNPTKQADDALQEVGLSASDLRAQIRDKGLLSVLTTLRDAFKGNDDALVNFFPNIRALTGVLNLVGQNADQTAAIFQSLAGTTGEDLKNAFAAAADTTKFQLDQSMAELRVTLISIGAIIVPLFTQLLQALQPLIKGIRNFTQEHPLLTKVVVILSAALVVLGTALIALSLMLPGLAFGITAVSAAMTFLAANPIGLVIVAVAALVAGIVLLVKNWDTVKEKAAAVWGAMVDIVRGAVNKMIGFVNALIRAFNSIKVTIPGWVPGVGGNEFGLNIPTVPQLQHGGIVTRPTMAMIGEAGPEAVIPLSNRGGQSQPIIVLQIDGRTIATVLGNQAVLEEQVRSS